jgi:hypothetical protein
MQQARSLWWSVTTAMLCFLILIAPLCLADELPGSSGTFPANFCIHAARVPRNLGRGSLRSSVCVCVCGVGLMFRHGRRGRDCDGRERS